MFKPAEPKVSFPALEEKILDFWQKNAIFQKSVDRPPKPGLPRDGVFVFYEGPPTANARPGIHHVLARVFKDIIPRYKTMQGYSVPRRAGWDTHGLPVELEIEKELGLKSKPEIEAYGIAAFNEKCRESVSRYVEEWTSLSERIAYWADLEHPYVTWHNEYIESCWWILKTLWDRGLVYQDYRSTPHCPRCGTSLSDHEVSQGYEDDTPDPSVFVKFRLTTESAAKLRETAGLPGDEPISLVAWTTTPWTLPGNTALAIKDDAPYGIYAHEGELLVMARALGTKVLGEGAIEMRWGVGEVLAGLTYEPLYRPEDLGSEVMRFRPDGHMGRLAAGESTEGVRRIIAAEYVSLEDGTGIVHMAPAFGGEDFEQGKLLGLLFAQPVDLRGVMADGLPGAGKFVKQADRDVIVDLEARGLMLKHGTIKHTYPFCWRCGTPLLYYAKPSWYIRTTKVKDSLIAGNQTINWYPEHIRDGRFGNWLENNIDWAVSRERYWGTPLPFWKCELCGQSTCVGSRQELADRAREKERAAAMTDLHRPFIDEITLDCANCGGTMRRVPEVADAWFDAGAMPYAQWQYPEKNHNQFDAAFPADYICEAIDQTRGWFYTLHAEATLLHAAEVIPESISYRNVICLGLILDEKGNKMSKSRGNAVVPWDVLEKTGADALRWYMFTSSPAGSARRFSTAQVEEGLRRFLLTLWNTYSFFVSYANIDGVDPRVRPTGPVPEIDRWLLSELNELVERVTREFEEYDPTDGGRAIESFVDDLSNWYVRRNRRRFWRGVSESDQDKQSAYFTLYTALVTVTKLLAPFTPFVAEEMYQNLVRSIEPNAPESVHLAEWPVADPSVIDTKLNEETQLVKRICSLGRAARAKAQIKVRLPVAQVLAKPRSPEESAALQRHTALVLEELNAKSLILLDDETAVVSYDVKPNLPVLGRKYAAGVAAIREGLATLASSEVAEAVRRGRTVEVAGHTLDPEDILLQANDTDGYASAQDAGYIVAVTTEISPELAEEGLAREIVRRIQDMRREAGFELADRITTYFQGDADIASAMTARSEYIRGETLSEALVEGVPPAGAHTATFDLEGAKVTLGVLKN